MKRIIIGMLLTLLVLMNSGCLATVSCVQKYNYKIDNKVLEMRILNEVNKGTTGAIVAVDVFQAKDLAKGYWAAWKNDTGAMATALGIDTVWMTAAAAGAEAIYDSIKDKEEESITIYLNDCVCE